MQSDYIVIFDNDGATVSADPIMISRYCDSPNVVRSPDLSKVSKHPPKYWKKVGDSVAVMTRDEMDIRDRSENPFIPKDAKAPVSDQEVLVDFYSSAMKDLAVVLTALSLFGIVACLMLILNGCGTAALSIDQNKFYKRDIDIIVNNKNYSGVAVLPKQSSYKINLESQGDFDFAIISSCARQLPFEKQGDSFTYVYTPNEIESSKACPLNIHSFDKDKSSDSDGFIDFMSDKYKLPLKLDCNGVQTQESGVSVCQSAQGLIQRYTFQSPVDMVWGKEDCKLSIPTEGTQFEFPLVSKQCLYIFRDKVSGLMHRTTTIGYEEILPRKL